MGSDGRDGNAPAASPLNPDAEFPALTDNERAALHRIGEQWTATVPGRAGRDAPMPVDPALGLAPDTRPSRLARLAPIRLFRAAPDHPGRDELVTTTPAPAPDSAAGRALVRLRRLVLGPPLASTALVRERMRKLVALPVLSSDLLSSVAYGPEAMLTVLALAGTAALGLSLPLAAALIGLMIVVGVSYRQTIPAYAHGAGSYLVASDNLGHRAGLTAGVGLMTDYILTVSVSVAAGVHTVTSAVPALAPFTVPLGLLFIGVLVAGNLRGIRAAGNLFAAPTYIFVLAIAALVAFGLADAAGRGFTPVPPPPVAAAEGLGLLLVLRAFSSGATSMTGIEAISNAVPIFRPVEWRNARTTLTWMIFMLVVLFAGLIVLFHLNGLVPRADETLLSQLARTTFPTGPWYLLVQAATALILMFAANTAFNDLPRLLFFVARDGYAPRRFLHMDDRLAFGNGILLLAGTSALIFVAFRGHTESLIPLYAVGVFLAFTLSQVGMVVHWRRHRERHWTRKLALNATGAVACALVLVTAAVTKFTEGAWVVVVAIPLMVLGALRIRAHYDAVRAALTPRPPGPGPSPDGDTATDRAGSTDRAESTDRAAATDRAAGPEAEEVPRQVRHLVVVPVLRLDLAALRALAYAASLGQPCLAVHISPDDGEADRFRAEWQAWGDHLRLEVVVSPYRAVIATLVGYLEALRALRPDVALTVVVPEIVVRRRWHRLLHGGTPRRLRRALRGRPGLVITSVPIHITR
ncbi:APC family permease [Polymorphospora sp. NPDC051019]|uniref:APC family permease n=1 Tax=Polymorphospora sp. NPDC051019 TaxID=3155725 RepID=UPI0034470E05